MYAWFETDIQRFERELTELESLNVSFKIDEQAKEQKLLRLYLSIEGNNPAFDLPDKTKEIKLVAVYPDLYPYFRPNVFAPDINLPRHQNPIDKGLCLLGRPTDLWDPQTTLGLFLKERLRLVLVQGEISDPEVLNKDNTEQAEPESEYFNPSETVIIDTSAIDTKPVNEIDFLGRITVGHPKDGTVGLRMAVLQIRDAAGAVISELPHGVREVFPETTQGVLYRIPKLQFLNATEQYKWLVDKLKEQGQIIHDRGKDIKINNKQSIKNIIGLNFPEETSPGHKEMIGWLFLVTGNLYKPAVTNGKDVRHHFHYYAKASRINASELNIRTPKLSSLQDKIVSIFGLGSLGAPCAIEFAKAGIGEIRLVDYDSVDIATSVRWPLGMMAAGLKKVTVLKSFIEGNYPFTKVSIANLKIGDHRANADTNTKEISPFELGQITELFENASLVFDATAEEGVTHYLAEESRKRVIPFVSIWGTEGGVGGQILRVIPNKTEGCWMCSMFHRFDETIKAPPSEQGGKIQTRGCGDISFTGTAFDLQNISLAGVRLAISTLCEGIKDGYPSFDWDISVMSLVSEDVESTSPTWKSYKLLSHPSCPYCSA